MDIHFKRVIKLWEDSSSEEKGGQGVLYSFPENLEEIAGWSLPGPQYSYIIDLYTSNLVYVSQSAYQLLGITPKEISLQKIMELLLPEYRIAVYQKEQTIVDFYFNFLTREMVTSYKAVYFYAIEDTFGNERIIMHQAVPISQTVNKEPTRLLVTHTDVSHLFLKPSENLSFISIDGKKSYFNVCYEEGIFQPPLSETEKVHPYFNFTEREKEIIEKYSEGISTSELADQLHISVHTLRTHRKNILKKSPYKNMNDLIWECKIIGVI